MHEVGPRSIIPTLNSDHFMTRWAHGFIFSRKNGTYGQIRLLEEKFFEFLVKHTTYKAAKISGANLQLWIW